MLVSRYVALVNRKDKRRLEYKKPTTNNKTEEDDNNEIDDEDVGKELCGGWRCSFPVITKLG